MLKTETVLVLLRVSFYPPASEAIMEVANLTEIKNLHTPNYGTKESVTLSVCYAGLATRAVFVILFLHQQAMIQ